MIITFPCAVPQVKSISSMQRPTIHLPSLQYFKPCLLLVATFAIYFAIYCYYLLLLLLSSLSYYCYHLSFVASKYISGAVELTTQLLKLINTLWLPVCRINKLGYSYPRRLSRSLTVEGYQLPEAAAKKVPKINTKSAEEQSAPASPRVCSVEANAPDKFCSGKLAVELQAPAEPQVLAVEADVPAAADVPLVLVVEPQAPAWAQQIVRFLQTGELPEEQEEAERVARQSSLYTF